MGAAWIRKAEKLRKAEKKHHNRKKVSTIKKRVSINILNHLKLQNEQKKPKFKIGSEKNDGWKMLADKPFFGLKRFLYNDIYV